MKESKNRKLQTFFSAACAILAIVFFYFLLNRIGIGCPILYFTGISCAGCGMTRAYLAIFRLNFVAAWQYHPLFWLPPIVVLALFFRRRLPKKIFRGILFTAVLLFVIIYLCRILDPSDQIVIFKPDSGMFFRFLNKLFT